MRYISRKVENRLKKGLERKKSILLLGPRQTGKTTLIKNLSVDIYINLADPAIRQACERDVERLSREIEGIKGKFPLIAIDEVQKVSYLMDAVQTLIDSGKAQFILTGSSVRKLRRSEEVNLLPGRVISLRMDPLLIDEIDKPDLEELLIYGSLPGILSEGCPSDREEDLFAYLTSYLEEEVRSEALVRHMGAFGNFLKLAAIDSGGISNFNKLSQAIGISASTINQYYQVLVDCLLVERIEALSVSNSRKRLIKSPRFLLYDLGVRRIAAAEGRDMPERYKGHLFEQWVGLELLRQLRTKPIRASLRYWRDVSGVEVDWVLEVGQKYFPIEVKWTKDPTPRDARHLRTFYEEYPNCDKAWVICRAPRPQKLYDNIFAIPWFMLPSILDECVF